jgi:hypothetical protein
MTFVTSVSAACAQEQLTGTWLHAGSKAEASKRTAAIASATEELPSFIRARARARITKRTAPVAQLSIAVDGDRVELTRRGSTIVVTVGGPPVRVSGDDGRGEIRASRRDGHLRISMTGEGGSLATTYKLSADGQRLVLHVRMTVKRLSEPIVFRATYRREGRDDRANATQ